MGDFVAPIDNEVQSSLWPEQWTSARPASLMSHGERA